MKGASVYNFVEKKVKITFIDFSSCEQRIRIGSKKGNEGGKEGKEKKLKRRCGKFARVREEKRKEDK